MRRMRRRMWENELRGRGYKFTRNREAILKVLKNSDKHLSAEEIFMMLKKEVPSIGIATVYRTLELLRRSGIILKFDFGDGCSRYELSRNHNEKGEHHHLVCRKCKKVIDFDSYTEEEKELMEKIKTDLEKKYEFEIEDYFIRFRGICNECKKKEEEL